MRTLQVAPAVPDEIGVLVTLEQNTVTGVPSMDGLAFHIERNGWKAGPSSKGDQTGVHQRPSVNDETAPAFASCEPRVHLP